MMYLESTLTGLSIGGMLQLIVEEYSERNWSYSENMSYLNGICQDKVASFDI